MRHAAHEHPGGARRGLREVAVDDRNGIVLRLHVAHGEGVWPITIPARAVDHFEFTLDPVELDVVVLRVRDVVRVLGAREREGVLDVRRVDAGCEAAEVLVLADGRAERGVRDREGVSRHRRIDVLVVAARGVGRVDAPRFDEGVFDPERVVLKVPPPHSPEAAAIELKVWRSSTS